MITNTIAEVAALAGVSPATVSRAMRGLPGVSPATRASVQRAASQLGYVASPSAAALTTGRTNAIGVLAPWVSRWFFASVIEGAQHVVTELGYDLLLYPIGASAGQHPDGLSIRALDKRVDGVLAVNVPLNPPSIHALQSMRVPVVMVGTEVAGMSAVLVDNVTVGRLATEHLLGLGHRRIAFFGIDPDDVFGFTVAAERRAGYDQALRAAGLSIDESLVHTTSLAVASGEAALRREWKRVDGQVALLPTAIFAVCDEVAMGVMYAARAYGLRVPDDLSVIGVDNHDLSYLFDLTTVGQPVRAQGGMAARMLLQQMTDPNRRAPSAARVDPALIIRGSTGPPRA